MTESIVLDIMGVSKKNTVHAIALANGSSVVRYASMNDYIPLPEIWKVIPFTDYEASSLGRIRHNGKILKPYPSRKYRVVDVHINGQRFPTYVHRLIAMLFVSDETPHLEVNHKDGNPKNNSMDNLEWVTPSENVRHSLSIGTHYIPGLSGENHGMAKMTDEQINLARELYSSGVKQAVLALQFNVTQSTISRIVNQKTYKERRP